MDIGVTFLIPTMVQSELANATASPGQMSAKRSANFFGCFKSRFVCGCLRCEMGGGAKAAIEVTSFLCLGILYST